MLSRASYLLRYARHADVLYPVASLQAIDAWTGDRG
jgi:hypothetical protein